MENIKNLKEDVDIIYSRLNINNKGLIPNNKLNTGFSRTCLNIDSSALNTNNYRVNSIWTNSTNY